MTAMLRIGRAARWLACFAVVVAVAPSATAVADQKGGQNLVGKFLVATAGMTDPRFAETVIYVCDHTATGAMGIVVNRPVKRVPTAELMDDLGLPDDGATGEVMLHYGGPVEVDRAFVLHSSDYDRDDANDIADGIRLSSDPTVFEDIAAGRGPDQSLVALGYAGWGPAQLDIEVAAGVWEVAPADLGLLFDPDAGGQWDRILDRDGFDI
ncbi:MAG: hypothetical protein CMM50_15370 [Rhodospirillaceae bacterium]|nr:hypothetical protein [Rhodospirillaceae bacterium]